MKPLDDMLPEEQDPQYEELIALLQRANLSPLVVDPAQRAHILSRARSRVMQVDPEVSITEHLPVPEIRELASLPSRPKARVDKQHRGGRLVHLLNELAAVLAVAALIGSALLIFKSSIIGRTGGIPTVPVSCNTTSNGFPSLTLSANAVSTGSTVTVTLKHFAPSTRVDLTHDIQEPISINGSSSITTDAQGCATFTFVIDTTWGPGFHLIVAEDVTSHSTASENLQITGEILPPCVLSPPSPATLTYSLAQGQATSTALNMALSETGTCARPVTWQASTGNAWLALTATSGTDSGTGSTFGVNATAANMVPGTYTGSIAITATDSTGAAVGSPQSVAVTLTVTGFTISGTVIACADQTCATPQPLAGATVTLISSSTTVATTTADASGTYSFTNIPLGSYTITVAGYDASNTHYVGSLPLTLTGNALNTTIQAFPG
jgi:hypothetical protein